MKKLLCSLLFCLAIAVTSQAQSSTDVVDIIEEGIRLYEEGNYKAAIEQHKEALKLDAKNPEANYELALTYFALKDMPNAIAYSNAVIKTRVAEPELRAQAHVNKGSALDVSGKPEKAIKEYYRAIKLAPRHHLAYYNLGLTHYNQKNYKEAEQYLTKALQFNQGHGSSHLLLAYIKQAQKQRVQSLLALYNFLLLEPASERAPAAYELLQQMQQEGVSKGNGNAINITVSADKLVDNPFSAAELMVSMTQASHSIEAQEVKTPEQLFYENTESFFNILGELREEKQDFWWSYYVEFFHEMALDKNVETFSYYISQSKSPASLNWLQKHPEKVEQLTSWYRNYKR
ncbi:tetratricopeptide repeat protein [Pontibacter pamirensis]|uniref:tetratricopeptide repeat protein n=1 Tax=Pontibacter pamirensis TaxID=2562824 RepID=UPI001389BEEF|nr:tetratricopeptide repeat protein [Pontibacter pamirensis]